MSLRRAGLKRPHSWTSERLALAAHLASLAAGGAWILWVTRNLWFEEDEFFFFRVLHPALEHGDWAVVLFKPYASHWVAVPNLVWALAYQVGGLHYYRAYLLPVVAAHLGTVALTRLVLRRAAVGPWLATGVALVPLLPGPGVVDVTFGWQIEFVGAMVFGLAQLVLTDHAGPVAMRDVAGLVFGLLAIMCSAVGVIMVIVVGASLALRKRWRAAAVATLPLAALYVAWYVKYGRAAMPAVGTRELLGVPRFVMDGVSATLDGMTSARGVGVLVAVAAVVVLIVARLGPTATRATNVWAMAFGGLLFFVATAPVRDTIWWGQPDSSRYLYVAEILFLPLLGVAVGQCARNRWLTLGVAAAIGWAFIHSAVEFNASVQAQAARSQAVRRLVVAIASDPNLGRLDPTEPVRHDGAGPLDIGTIQRLHQEGQLP